MALAIGGNGGNGVAVLVSAGLVYEVIAFACCSPQTAEINIKKRGTTLMKWVHLGQALSLVTIVFAASIDKERRSAILIGGFFAMGSAEGFYIYAKKSGMEKPGPVTEEVYTGAEVGY